MTPKEAARHLTKESQSADNDKDSDSDNVKEESEKVKDPAAAIKKLEKKINRLGQVSLGAIDDYKELKERYDYLESEQEDLYKAKESIEEVIADLEEKMSVLFHETYQEVNEQFKDIFTRLFMGGELV